MSSNSMGSDTIIQVNGLSKKYTLGTFTHGDHGIRHLIERVVTSPFRAFGNRREPNPTDSANEFWALSDVTFQIERGDVMGIIGRNGAGKSTLLKILSRITEPTRGSIGIKGRIVSLLEVGTGFHAELTGRENIFLNGAILGMRQSEVRAKLDEIIAFAGVEKFLDTPVKRYSSGMYVRLAFAVAAHLEPEILVIDEVLAVGDSEFQKKCLGKMKEVSTAGRTVLFVSHNLSAVAALCNKAMYLKSGRMHMAGECGEVISRYQSDVSNPEEEPVSNPAFRSGRGTHRIIALRSASKEFAPRGPLEFVAKIHRHKSEGAFHFSMHFRNEWDVEVFAVNSDHLEGVSLREGNQEITLRINAPWLPPGDYRADAYLHFNGIIDHWPDACRFRIGADVAVRGYSAISAEHTGLILADFTMQIQPIEEQTS
ncbi:MAG: polysaccharide ABC transporter ATP-binding protein [Verrucomicrobiota bacterium]